MFQNPNVDARNGIFYSAGHDLHITQTIDVTGNEFLSLDISMLTSFSGSDNITGKR
jgi:hypothetical protein